MGTESVLLTRRGNIAVLTLNRPERRNALSTEMRECLGAHLAAIADDPSIQVVLLRGEGAAFCAGADLEDAPSSSLAWRDRILMAQQHHLQILRMSKIFIAAVQGAAFGGGASLALTADILMLADDAVLGFPFVRLGVVPDGGATFLLQAKLGPAVAQDLVLTGGTLKADEAKTLGLTRRVLPVDQLREASDTLAAELAHLPHEALMLTKALGCHSWQHNIAGAFAHEADAFALATSTDSHRTALAAAKASIARKRKSDV